MSAWGLLVMHNMLSNMLLKLMTVAVYRNLTVEIGQLLVAEYVAKAII